MNASENSTPTQQPLPPDDSHEAHEFDVQQIHEPVIREHNEPRDGLEPIPVWMGMLFGALLFWGGMYMASNSADYRADAFDRHVPRPPIYKQEVIPKDEAGLRKLGEKIYANCVACHQATGEGMPKQYPALNQSEWVVGEKASTARLTRILLYGLTGEITVRGQPFNGAMPAWGKQLRDYQIAAVLTYIRSNWGNKAGPVMIEDVRAARIAVGDRPPFSAAELEKIPIDLIDPGATPASPVKK